MDPLSIAGLGIGAASIAFQAFAGCIKGFVILSTAHRFDRDRSMLVCLLNIQELQLTEWAREAGLLSNPPALDQRLNQTIVCDVLLQLQSLLLDTEKLQGKYKIATTMANRFVAQGDQQPEDDQSESQDGLRQGVSNDVRGDVMYRAGIIQSRNSFPRRLWWAAVDKAKFQEYIDTIRTLTAELWRLFDNFRQKEMSQGLQDVLAHVIGTNDRLDELAAIKDALHNPNSMIEHNQPNEALASAAGIRTLIVRGTEAHTAERLPMTLSMNAKDSKPTLDSFPIPPPELDTASIEAFKPLKYSTNIGLASLKGKAVLVEWKEMSRQFRGKMIERAQELGVLLSAPKDESFRSLRCEGLARDSDGARIAFIFTLPSQQGGRPIQSLRNMFGLSPSVTERFRLALQLVQSLKYFHTAGWLHKDLRSENIIFLSLDKPLPLANPVFAGFSFARLDSACAISEQPSSDPQHDIYRHPDAMGEPSESYTASKDIYSLGTILLEIGEWRSLKSLVEKVVDTSKTDVPLTSLAKIRPFLLEDGPKGGLGMLKYRMGDIYTGVVQMMLSGKVPQNWQIAEHMPGLRSLGVLDVAIRQLGRCVV